MAIDVGSYLSDLTKSQVQTQGSNSGITSVPTTTKLFVKMNNAIKSMDGADLDADNGSERLGAKDENGKLKISYGKCLVCGKELEKPTKDGMCSFKCQMKQNVQNITSDIKTLQDASENMQGKMSNIASSMSSLMSTLSNMTSLLSEVTSMGLDPKYLAYFKLKLNTIIQYVNVKVLETLILKNEKMLTAIGKAKAGIDAASGSALSALQSAQKAIAAGQALLSKFQGLFDTIYNAITSATPTLLYPESLHFGMTPRSAIKLPGHLVNKLENNNQNNSIEEIHFFDKINTIVSNAFPEIQEPEYVLPPAAFNVRKLLSKENVQSVQKMVDTLALVLKGPTEPLPAYKDLKITNIQFLLFLLSSWGPQGLNHFAMPLYP